MIGTLALLVGLIILSGFFSGAEIAFFSITQPKVRALVDERRAGARALASIKAEPEKLLITILIGNNVANIAAASVATYAAIQTFGSVGVGLATGVVTLLVLFFGEIAPKSFAARNATRLALMAAPVVIGLSRVMLPLVWPLERLVQAVLPGGNPVPRVTERDIRTMTRMGLQAGEIEEHERHIIERAFTLDRRRAWEVMTPRVEIFSWSADLKLSEVARSLGDVRYSRVPLYGASPDDVTGVLHVRDAYLALLSGHRDVPLGELAREPLFVPESISLINLLEQFRTRRIHMGLVVDEHGGIDGLVTLEDILEELVGEIVDETDVPEEPIVRINRNELLIQGTADLREINHFFNTTFPLLEYRSLNGYLLDELGRVPVAGEEIERLGVTIEILQATDTQVTRVRMRRPVPPASRVPDPSGRR